MRGGRNNLHVDRGKGAVRDRTAQRASKGEARVEINALGLLGSGCGSHRGTVVIEARNPKETRGGRVRCGQGGKKSRASRAKQRGKNAVRIYGAGTNQNFETRIQDENEVGRVGLT